MSRVALLLSLFALLPACDRSKINEAKWKEAGAEAVLPFKKNLKEALVKGLEEGPTQAISACRVEAPKLAEAASTGGIKVGRTSQKLRNPNNASKLWMQSFLRVYETDPERREPGVVLIDDNTVGYVEPIFVQPLCVTCHGAELAPDLSAKLTELYPEDQATGYAAGDFRGIFWAELPRK
ncbi:MAG: DUF3365 domain-containing protein [Myxococcales bacterium]|nr:MAG: DUF3365 domain-containing protein [Myxococcales bacterium]